MRTLIILFAGILLSQFSFTQGTAGSSSTLEPRFIVDMPSAGILAHLQYAADVEFYQSGGVLFKFSLGLINTFDLGISYGGTNIIGSEKPVWNKLPGISLKIRPIDETEVLPAIVLGFESQGKENYIDSLNRYKIKSPGLYIISSKNFLMFGYLSVHGGINYSLEKADGDKDINAFVGIEKTLGSFISAIAEYNLAINDSDQKALGRGNGYLNFSIRASIGNGFTLGFNFKDITGNQQKISIANRTISIEYIGRF